MKRITLKKALFFLALGAVSLFVACKNPVDTLPTAAVTGVSLNETKLTLIVEEATDLIVAVSPDNATNKNVTWASSDDSIVRVDNGRVSAVDLGTATITVTTEDGGFTAKCTVTVEPDSQAIAVSGVSLDQTELNMLESDTATLIPIVEPEDAAYQSVTWASSDDDVVTVNKKGDVTAIAPGEATITVTTKHGGFTAECAVTVEAAPTLVSGVSLDKTELTLKMEETETLTASVEPEDATNQKVTWASSDPGIAEVDNNGVVAAKSVGKATVTVTTVNGSKTAECIVTVTPIPVDRVELGNNSVEKNGIQQPIFLTATVYPPNATNKNVSWSSSAPNVATVEATGEEGEARVTFIGSGNATITVTTEDGGETATCSIIVNPLDPTSVTLKSALTLLQGQSETLLVSFNPPFTTNKSVTWSSDHETIATVDNNGLVTAIARGDATITVTTVPGGHTATCVVTVITPVSGVSLDESSLLLTAVGQTSQLTATVNPSGATNKNVTWSSSDEAVATVDNDGLVTAKAAGTATITVETEESGFTAACAVTVIVPVSGVTLNKSAITLIREQIMTLTASIQPEGATNKNVTWDSNNSAVASVENGLVTAKAAGTATITVKTEDGDFTADCAVTVNPKTYTVTFDCMDAITSIGPVTVAEWTTFTAPAAPNKNEYNGKLGWYKDVECTDDNEWNFAIHTVTGNITLHAKWRPYKLGEIGPGGGKIFYRDDNGFTITYNSSTAHYLEAAPTDVLGTNGLPHSSIAWSSSSKGEENISTENGIGTGRKNTANIDEGDGGSQYAAKSCINYGENTQNWFLPSKDELQVLCSMNSTLSLGLITTTGTNNGRYWSSSQAPINGTKYDRAYARTAGGTETQISKTVLSSFVRPIRAF
jgi:uncharacterized protein YjdB